VHGRRSASRDNRTTRIAVNGRKTSPNIECPCCAVVLKSLRRLQTFVKEQTSMLPVTGK
jgi:hypothetical protein